MAANESKVLDALYSCMQSTEGKLGGGEGIEGIYGSITQNGMNQVYACMSRNTGFGSTSVLLDVGAGLGRPLLHALLSPGVSACRGIEIDHVKVAKAEAFITKVLKTLQEKGLVQDELSRPSITCSPIEKIETLNPATHAYSFWEGVPETARLAFGRLFSRSKTLRAVTVVQRSMRKQDPSLVMYELGFGRLHLVGSMPVKMSGSGSSFVAYIFSKIPAASNAFFDAVEGADIAASMPLTPSSHFATLTLREKQASSAVIDDCNNKPPPMTGLDSSISDVPISEVATAVERTAATAVVLPKTDQLIKQLHQQHQEGVRDESARRTGGASSEISAGVSLAAASSVSDQDINREIEALSTAAGSNALESERRVPDHSGSDPSGVPDQGSPPKKAKSGAEEEERRANVRVPKLPSFSAEEADTRDAIFPAKIHIVNSQPAEVHIRRSGRLAKDVKDKDQQSITSVLKVKKVSKVGLLNSKVMPSSTRNIEADVLLSQVRGNC